MNLHNFVGAYRQSFKILLILQGNQAFWFKWEQGVLRDSFVEPIDASKVTTQSRCPWIDPDSDALNNADSVELGSDLAIELILDTSLDELDRVKVDIHSSRLIQRIQRNTLLRKLDADFPSATVNSLPDYLEPECASILHHVIPENWDQWLQELQNRAVTITHVVTGTELLCRWSGSCRALRLLVQDLGGDKRHLLLDASTPIYMRVVHNHTQSVGQTLDHIKEHVLPVGREPEVVTLTQMGPYPSNEYASTRLLSALYLGHTADLIENRLDPIELLEGNAVDPSADTDLLPAISCASAAIHKEVGLKWNRFLHRLGAGDWYLSGRARIVGQLFSPSLNKNRQRNRIVRLQNATILCAAIATVTTTVASFHGFTSARERYRLNSEQAQLRSNVGVLSQSASALHQAPLFVVNSLQRINNHRAVEPLDPEAVLSTIAEAITQFPTVTLDGLAWAVISDSHVLDQIYTSATGVSSRTNIWLESSPRESIQLELSGTVDGVGGLREKQSTIDSLVTHLKSVNGISLVTVLDSPVAAVRSSADLLGSLSSYRVSILFGSL